MLILISPAKRLDFDTQWESTVLTKPLQLDQATTLVDNLVKMHELELAQNLSISAKLAELNYDRFAAWTADHNKSNSKPAVLAYQGDVFQKFNHREFTPDDKTYLQNYLRIISGLYGLLRPFDLIQAYRLEMKTKLKVGNTKNLYQYWDSSLTKLIQNEIDQNNHKVVINLASGEYSKAIDFKSLSVPTVTIGFKQTTSKGIKSVMLPIKHARGMLIDYMIDNNVKTVDDMANFNAHGYTLSTRTDESLVFIQERK